MKQLLEEWSIKGGTLTQLEDALFHIDKKDIISGMLYYYMLYLSQNCHYSIVCHNIYISSFN